MYSPSTRTECSRMRCSGAARSTACRECSRQRKSTNHLCGMVRKSGGMQHESCWPPAGWQAGQHRAAAAQRPHPGSRRRTGMARRICGSRSSPPAGQEWPSTRGSECSPAAAASSARCMRQASRTAGGSRTRHLSRLLPNASLAGRLRRLPPRTGSMPLAAGSPPTWRQWFPSGNCWSAPMHACWVPSKHVICTVGGVGRLPGRSAVAPGQGQAL